MTRKINPKIYVGFKQTTRVVFRSATTPTRASHGDRFLAVMGPYRTMRAAQLTALTYPNPHIMHVNDAERIAKVLQPLTKEGQNYA